MSLSTELSLQARMSWVFLWKCVFRTLFCRDSLIFIRTKYEESSYSEPGQIPGWGGEKNSGCLLTRIGRGKLYQLGNIPVVTPTE
jgi:hypothetical protein